MEETLNNIGSTGNGIITKDDAGMYSIRYNDFFAPLVKSMQEQQVIIQESKVRISTLEEKNKQLEDRLRVLEDKFKQ